jgi:hypothetical protein
METFAKRVTYLQDETILFCHIITNYVAYGNVLARIEKEDWEMMCKAEAFDHIYLDDRTKSHNLGFDILVSKGPWKVDYTI